MQSLRSLVIVNAGGGTVRRAGEALDDDAIERAFAAAGASAILVRVEGGEIEAEARRALEAVRRGELDAIVAAGGDGTVSAVAGVLAGTGVPLGILPLGTLNHFAKDLGIPVELEAAAKVIAAGHVRPVDAAEVNGRVFVNNSSVGVYPYMVLERERQQRRGWSKWAGMGLAAWRAARRFPRRRLTVRSADGAMSCRTPCVFIGNNEYGVGLAQLGKRERLDAAHLSIYVARHRDRLGLLRLAWAAARGCLDGERDFERLEVAEAELRSRASRLIVALDGEVETLETPLRYRVRPGALKVLAPAAAA